MKNHKKCDWFKERVGKRINWEILKDTYFGSKRVSGHTTITDEEQAIDYFQYQNMGYIFSDYESV